jgi:single-strand DNA-binding protein
MPNFNRVFLMGNLTRDPELRYTPSNTPVLTVGLAVNRRWRNQQGENQEEVTFVDCDAFGRTAEVISQYLKKGRPIFIEGRLKLDQWQDKDGGNRSKLKVVIESFEFVDSRNEADGGGSGGGDAGGGGNYPPKRSTASPGSGAANPGPSAAAANRPPANNSYNPDAHQAVEEGDIPF